jgi:hypothetical protein
VIPGLGQIINGQTRKGSAILITVFFIFLAGLIWLFQMVRLVADELEPIHPDPTTVFHHIQDKDLTLLWLLLLAFALLWLFSVIDAFLQGKNSDSTQEGKLG